MIISKKQMQHARFMEFFTLANQSLTMAVTRAGFTLIELDEFDEHATRIVDHMTALLLRMDRAKN